MSEKRLFTKEGGDNSDLIDWKDELCGKGLKEEIVRSAANTIEDVELLIALGYTPDKSFDAIREESTHLQYMFPYSRKSEFTNYHVSRDNGLFGTCLVDTDVTNWEFGEDARRILTKWNNDALSTVSKNS